jgi:hypothetical protein
MDWGNDSLWNADTTAPSNASGYGNTLYDRSYSSSYKYSVESTKEIIRKYLKKDPEFLNELIAEQRKIKIEKIKNKI